tara:strand:- start:231 stop:737 length:507 start_codon:yes stop_codon:yes gene_type:complete
MKKLVLTLILPIALIMSGLAILVYGALRQSIAFFGVGLFIMISGAVTFFFIKKRSKMSVWGLFAMSWLTMDGAFHAFALSNFVEGRAPDAVIARGLFGLAGALPIWVHRIMGAFLLITTFYAFYLFYRKKEWNLFERVYTKIYLYVEAPISIAIIALGIILNLLGVGV